ncbi:hypothetical protein [Nocardia iowensis]|uniref:Uncharacterized protein n=1 Tax=Nocardia iowensis TaxID=204891 RepID=A0ABX8RMA3_NOCIO|nr:hypothetical protein [Nocardia iowensis]QXN90446.1 hypothetical protein KV110_34440 [Nocardia iowensis]
MESSRTKIAGPAIAAGAVSLGLVLIGACGLDKQDTYVAPPPLQSDPYVAPAAHQEPSGTVPKVSIPPSPTWQIAPYQAPHATPFTGFSTTTSGEPPAAEPHGSLPHENPSEDERPQATTTESTTPTDSPTTRPTTRPRPRPTTTEPDEPPTTRPQAGLSNDHDE